MFIYSLTKFKLGAWLLAFVFCGLSLGLAAQSATKPMPSGLSGSSRSSGDYKIAEIYITGLEKLSEQHIQRYLNEYNIRLNAWRSKKQLERAALHLANFADSESTLLSLELVYDYSDDLATGSKVYVEVLVSEMSIDFIPGGGNAYALFGWANRIERDGRPSLLELALGYNRQDFMLDMPYLWDSPLGFNLKVGHQILEQWDFDNSSRIRSNAFIIPQLYLQPLSWKKLGVGLDLGSLYFLKGQNPDNTELGGRLGLGPKLNVEGVPGSLQGRLALLGHLSMDRDYLARRGLGYHLRLNSRHELLGLFAGNHSVALALGLVTEPVKWFRPSLELRGDWRSDGMLPLVSEVFSSRYEGYIRGAAELRLLFTPLNIREPIAIDIGWNLGGIIGFTNSTQNFNDINFERDLELSLFAGPEIYFGMPVNVRGQFDFGIILREQFQKIDFAFNIRVL